MLCFCESTAILWRVGKRSRGAADCSQLQVSMEARVYVHTHNTHIHTPSSIKIHQHNHLQLIDHAMVLITTLLFHLGILVLSWTRQKADSYLNRNRTGLSHTDEAGKLSRSLHKSWSSRTSIWGATRLETETSIMTAPWWLRSRVHPSSFTGLIGLACRWPPELRRKCISGSAWRQRPIYVYSFRNLP